jgi:hypothetical protein
MMAIMRLEMLLNRVAIEGAMYQFHDLNIDQLAFTKLLCHLK